MGPPPVANAGNAVGPQGSGDVWRPQEHSDYPEELGRPVQFPLSYFADGNLDLFAELGGFDPDLAASTSG
jgi:hypothetical protein